MSESSSHAWARAEGGEYWPAEVTSVSEDGRLHVSYIGWDARHDRWIEPPDPADEDPELLFKPPRRRVVRRSDSTSADTPEEPSPVAFEAAGRRSPDTVERVQPQAKRQKLCHSSELQNIELRFIEGPHCGKLGRIIGGHCGYLKFKLRDTGEVVFARSFQLERAENGTRTRAVGGAPSAGDGASSAADGASGDKPDGRVAEVCRLAAPPERAEPRRPSTWFECFCGTARHLLSNPLPFEGVWIQCGKCHRWCHAECTGLPPEHFSRPYLCPYRRWSAQVRLAMAALPGLRRLPW